MVFFFFNTRDRKAKREKNAEDWIRSLEERSEGLSEILLAFFSTKVSSRVCVCFSTTMMMMTMMMMMMMMMMTTTTLACVVLRLRIANQMVMDSC